MVSTKSTCNSPFSRPNIQAPLYQSCTFLAAFRTNLPKHCNFGTGVKDQQEFREAAERRERGAATTFHPQTACSTSFDKSKPQNGSPSAQMSAYNFKQSQYKRSSFGVGVASDSRSHCQHRLRTANGESEERLEQLLVLVRPALPPSCLSVIRRPLVLSGRPSNSSSHLPFALHCFLSQ